MQIPTNITGEPTGFGLFDHGLLKTHSLYIHALSTLFCIYIYTELVISITIVIIIIITIVDIIVTIYLLIYLFIDLLMYFIYLFI